MDVLGYLNHNLRKQNLAWLYYLTILYWLMVANTLIYSLAGNGYASIIFKSIQDIFELQMLIYPGTCCAPDCTLKRKIS